MKKLRVLLGCEESQALAKEFRRLGQEAFSCDLEAASGGHPEWHLQCDIFDVIGEGWDLMIGFPPCTHLAVSGAKHFGGKRLDGRQKEAIRFFVKLWNSPIEHLALENPVGIMARNYIFKHFPEMVEELAVFGFPRKPDQIVQPWQFGDSFQKKTCLWLKNLPPLKHTEIVSKGEFVTTPSGKKLPKWYSDNTSAKNRSKTFPGIARAAAEQWTEYLLNK